MTTIVKIFIILATATSMVLSVSAVKSNDTYTSTQIFCAYGQVFVEFNEGDRKWGTLWLDRNGKPVPCKEDEPNAQNYLKGKYDESV